MVVVALDSQLRVDLLGRVNSVLTSAVDGVWQAATTSPVIGILLVAAIVVGSVRTARRARHSKRAHVPTDRKLRTIDARRAGYFRAGTCPAVRRRRVTTGFAARTVEVTTPVAGSVPRVRIRRSSSRDGAERAGGRTPLTPVRLSVA